MFGRSTKMLRKLVIAILAIVVVSVSTQATAACKFLVGGVPWAWGTNTTSILRITDHSTCTSRNFYPENIESIKITRKPTHGLAGKAEVAGIAYQPNKDYKGPDRFSYAITSNANCICGRGKVATIDVEVQVE